MSETVTTLGTSVENPPRTIAHGTNAGYFYGCRDACCREAHAVYRRSVWRKRYVRGVDRLYIDATGTQRRIRALQAMGWRLPDLDAAVGTGRGWHHNLLGQAKVHVDTAAKVAAVYEERCMTPGPSARLRGLAAKWGWPPPLAWDDIDTDAEAPGSCPHPPVDDALPAGAEAVDPVVVERILSGEWRLPSTPAEKSEVCRRWVAQGGSTYQLEQMTGWRVQRYYRKDVA